MAKLGDLFLHIKNGANIKQGLDNTGYPITRIETISNRTVDRNKMGYAGITDLGKYSDFIMQDGDILMSHINSETHLGKTALYEKEDDEIIIHGMNLLSLRPNKNLITSKYCFYYFSSQSFLRQIPNITKKSVNQASFTVSALKELAFPLTSIEEQKKITTDLDHISNLISLRKQQLSKLDELVKSRFIELFSDGRDGKTPVRMLGSICKFQQGTQIPVDEQFEEQKSGYKRFLRIIDYTQAPQPPRFVNVNGKEVDEKSVVIVRYGATAGFVGRGYQGILANNLFEIIPDETILSKDFLFLALKHGTFEKAVHDKAFGAAMPALSFSMMNDIPVVVPMPEQQSQFVSFVEQTDKSKFEIQESLEKLETLKKALMQKYFG